VHIDRSARCRQALGRRAAGWPDQDHVHISAAVKCTIGLAKLSSCQCIGISPRWTATLALHVLDTAVRFELGTRSLPIEVAIHNSVYDLDDSIDRADQLRRRIAFSVQVSIGTSSCACMYVSTYRKVIVPLLREAKSTVHPNGVPNSSFLAYFLPIDAEESSTRDAIPIFRILRAVN
jgi:hypothetical protein